MLRRSTSGKARRAQPRRCQARDPFEPITLRRLAVRPGSRAERSHPLRAYGRR